MTCVSQEELARLALESDASALSLHVAQCARCQARLAAMQSLIQELSAVHATLERNHIESRARLLASLSHESQSVRIQARLSIIPWFRSLTMKQRLALAAMSAAVMFGIILFWISSVPTPLMAMDEMAKSIRAARSFSVKIEQQLVHRDKTQSGVAPEMTGKMYWHTPGSVRIELSSAELNQGLDSVSIYPAGKPGISIDHKTKSFTREPPRLGYVSPIMLFDGLAKYSGEADRDLGTKDIDGKQTHGFLLNARKVDPDIHEGSLEIWVDSQSNLPIEIRYEITEGPSFAMRMFDFEWNTELDAQLFEAVAPEDYKDATQKSPTLAEQIADIRKSLETYAEFSGGHYPRVKMVYGDVTRDELRKLAGIKGLPTAKDFENKNYEKVQAATIGFARINGILRDNEDAAYYGRTVGPADKDKVLLRWKLEDNNYQVLYGDLHSELISAEKLKELEGD